MKFFIFAVLLIYSLELQENRRDDCFGILIDRSEFDLHVERINGLYETGKIHKLKDFILSVRIHNTISMNSLNLEALKYNSFDENFVNRYLDQTIKVLGAKVSKGLGFYSKKYDIFIGGPKHRNSYFCFK